MEIIDYVSLGREIKKSREKKQITQERLAEKVGLSSTHISNIETAHTKVSLSALVLIANELEESVDDLLSNSLHLSTDSASMTNSFTPEEIKIMNEVMSTLKTAFRRYK